MWSHLVQDLASEAVEPLREIVIGQWRRRPESGINLDIASSFPVHYKRVLERALQGGLRLSSIRPEWTPHFAPQLGQFVLERLGDMGDLESVTSIRPFISDERWGPAAVAAIRTIQARTT